MDLWERVALLQSSGQITKAERLQLDKLLTELRDAWSIPLEDETAVSLVTHLALAGARVNRQETVAPLEAALVAEVHRSAFYERSQAMLDRIETLLQVSFPTEEKGYLLLHLCNLLQKVEEAR